MRRHLRRVKARVARRSLLVAEYRRYIRDLESTRHGVVFVHTSLYPDLIADGTVAVGGRLFTGELGNIHG